MPHELSSSVVPHQDPKYISYMFYSNVCKQYKCKQTLYSVKTWFKYHVDVLDGQCLYTQLSGYISPGPCLSFLPKQRWDSAKLLFQLRILAVALSCIQMT
jgi:hypothetical protein